MLKRLGMLYGIDLGTSNTVIYQQGKGIVLREPSVVAVNRETGGILAFGQDAYVMVGRTPGNVDVIYPLIDGVIANFDLTAAMLQHFIKKIKGRSPWFRSSQAYISVPSEITHVQKRAVEDITIHKGSTRSIVVEEPLAAALGAGLPVDEPLGNLVLDIGGGTSQVAILSLGGIVVSRTVRRAGMSIDRDITEYVKKTYNLAIGERTAEEIKKRIGSAIRPDADTKMEIRGRDLIDGLPRSIQLRSTEVYELLDDFLMAIFEAIRLTLEQCPPELAGDVVEQGMLLCGGGALLHGLDKRIQTETGVPVFVADEPQDCTALGAGMMLDYLSRHSDRGKGFTSKSKQEASAGLEE